MASDGQMGTELWRVFSLFLDRPARGVCQNFLESWLTVKLLLVRRCYADLPDKGGACICSGVNLFHVLFVDRADIAYGMNRDIAQRVVSRETSAYVDARKLPAV